MRKSVTPPATNVGASAKYNAAKEVEVANPALHRSRDSERLADSNSWNWLAYAQHFLGAEHAKLRQRT
jgi:hypothetical protein